MEPKLQQAIVATRAGRIDVAQSLLVQLINEHPDDPNAWFLLSHLVNSEDRQARYLNKVLQIDPDHELAKKRLAEMPESPIPAPVITRDIGGEREVSTEETTGIVEEVTITPSTPILKEVAVDPPLETKDEPQLPDWLQDLEQVRLGEQQKRQETDEEWLKAPGTPKREASNKPSQTATIAAPIAGNGDQKSQGDAWLIRILLLMVLVAFIVLGFLIILILI